MSRGGCSDLDHASRVLCAEQRMPHACVLSSTDRSQVALRSRKRRSMSQGSIQGPPQWCGARRRGQVTVREGLLNSASVAPVAAPPRCPIEIASNEVNLLTRHDGTDCEDEFFGDTSLLG